MYRFHYKALAKKTGEPREDFAFCERKNLPEKIVAYWNKLGQHTGHKYELLSTEKVGSVPKNLYIFTSEQNGYFNEV